MKIVRFLSLSYFYRHQSSISTTLLGTSDTKRGEATSFVREYCLIDEDSDIQ